MTDAEGLLDWSESDEKLFGVGVFGLDMFWGSNRVGMLLEG